MGFIAMRCPSCGADLQCENDREVWFCNYCGTKITREKTIVEHTGTINIKAAEPIKVVNQEFESKLALAKNAAERFLLVGPTSGVMSIVDVDKILLLFSQAESVGATESRVYEESADFIYRALSLLKERDLLILRGEGDIKKKTIDYYVQQMTLAIKYAQNEEEKSRLTAKYNATLPKYKDLISQAKARTPAWALKIGCLIGAAIGFLMLLLYFSTH